MSPTATVSPGRATDSAAGIHLIFVTHCLYDEGLFRQAGFGPCAASTNDALLLRFASEYAAYELPSGFPTGSPQLMDAPRRLALVRIPGGLAALIHSVFLLDDRRGRSNSFF